jgi:hypothetical protein
VSCQGVIGGKDLDFSVADGDCHGFSLIGCDEREQ